VLAGDLPLESQRRNDLVAAEAEIVLEIERGAFSVAQRRIEPDLGAHADPTARELEVELVEERLEAALRLGRCGRREHQSNEHRGNYKVITISDHGQSSSLVGFRN